MNDDFKSVLLADLAVNWHHRGRTEAPTTWLDVARSLTDPRFVPVALVRTAAWLHRHGGPVAPLAKVVALVNRFSFGVECALQTQIGPGLYFPHTGGIVIGATRLGARCTVYHQVTLGAKEIDMPFTPDRRPSVGDDVVLAAGSKVLGGIVVDDGAIVAANAVVVHDVAPGVTVGGIPAKPLRGKQA